VLLLLLLRPVNRSARTFWILLRLHKTFPLRPLCVASAPFLSTFRQRLKTFLFPRPHSPTVGPIIDNSTYFPPSVDPEVIFYSDHSKNSGSIELIDWLIGIRKDFNHVGLARDETVELARCRSGWSGRVACSVSSTRHGMNSGLRSSGSRPFTC